MPANTSNRVRDPVCGMLVDPAKAAATFDYQGQTYYFCNPGCLKKFQAQPDVYLSTVPVASGMQVPVVTLPSVGAGAKHSEGASWTCPMHPEIVRDEPGSCPICGMALEPRTITAADEPNRELVDMSKRFWLSVAFSVPLFLMAMTDMLPGRPLEHWFGPTALRWLEFALATPVVLWWGWPIFERGWQSIVHRSLNMFTLIAIGTGAAYGFSVIATFAPQWFPESLHSHGGQIGVYFESAAVIITLVLLGQVLELRARGQTSSAIRCAVGTRAERRPGESNPMAVNTMCRWNRSSRATRCVCGQVKKFRSMAK